MPRPNRRTDLGEREGPFGRAARQALRQAGDGVGSGPSSTAIWGAIIGTIEDQTDLKELTDNLEALAVFEEI